MSDAAFPLKQLNRTFTGSVLFIDIVGYSTRAVPGRLEMKELFNTMLAEAVQNVAPIERIMVDTGNGAAIAFLGDPEDALFAALSLRDAIETAALPVGEPGFIRMGINLGPLKIVRDINGHTNMIGDGVSDAQRIMHFSRPGQLMASHAYVDVISGSWRDYMQLFVCEGTQDAREHAAYRFSPSPDDKALTEKLRERSRTRRSMLEDPENAFTSESGRSHRVAVNHRKGSGRRPGLIAAAAGATTLAGAAWLWTANPLPQPVTATRVYDVPAMDAVVRTRIDATKAADIRAAVKHAAENPGAAPPAKRGPVKISIQP